jgi:hypothetical protein
MYSYYYLLETELRFGAGSTSLCVTKASIKWIHISGHFPSSKVKFKKHTTFRELALRSSPSDTIKPNHLVFSNIPN